MTSPAAVLTKVGQINLRAKDLPRAVAFWRDVMGVPFLFEAPGMAFFQVGDVRLMFGPAEKPEFDHPSSILYFTVGDVRKAHAELSKRGVRFREAPIIVHKTEKSDLWMAFFLDSEDNTLALMSELPRS